MPNRLLGFLTGCSDKFSVEKFNQTSFFLNNVSASRILGV